MSLFHLLSVLVALHALLPAANALVHHINVTSSNTYTPALLHATTGDTVVWTNVPDDDPHNVISDSGLFVCSDSCFVNSSIPQSSNLVVHSPSGNGSASNLEWSFNITFNSAGLFPYHCEALGEPGLVGMSGLVYVVDPPAPVVHLSYNGIIRGSDFVAILVGVMGGTFLAVVLLVLAIAAFRNRATLTAPLHRSFHMNQR